MNCLRLSYSSCSLPLPWWMLTDGLTKITLHAHFPVSNHMTSCSQSKYFSFQTPYQLAKTFMNIYEFIYFFNVCVCMCSLVSDSLWSHGLLPSRHLSPWHFLGKNTGVCCYFLLQGFFPTQGLNPHPQCLLHCRHLLHHWAMKEGHVCFYTVSILVPKKVGNWLQHPNLCPWNVSQCCCFSKKALNGT